MALFGENEVQCLSGQYLDQVENVPLTPRQQKFVDAELARYRAEVGARHSREAQRLAGEVGDLKTAVLTGLQEIANGYQQVEASYELGDIDRNTARGRIQSLQARERRLEERQDALQSLLDMAERHSATDAVEYSESILRKYPSLPRPTFRLPV